MFCGASILFCAFFATKVESAEVIGLTCNRLCVEDLKDLVAFAGRHPSGSLSPADAERIVRTLVRGPDALLDVHDHRGRLAVAAVVDTCVNVDDCADFAILGVREDVWSSAALQFFFDKAEEVARRGPRGALDVILAPERASWAGFLRARGYETAYLQYTMECPASAVPPSPMRPLPESWRWMEIEDDQFVDYHHVVSAAFADVPGAFVPNIEEMKLALKQARWRPNVLVEGRRVRAFATIQLHERAGGLIGEVRSIGRDPGLRGAGIGEHLLQHALALLRKAGSVKKFELETTARNEVALRLYRRYGFEVVQSMPVYRLSLHSPN
jgi:ribosomal protein S18 acetylase RimI-like enzyme